MNAILLTILTTLTTLTIRAQCLTSAAVWDSLIAVEKSSRPPAVRLQQLDGLKQLSQRCHLPKDSVYARILHRSGLYQYQLNHNIPTNTAIENTQEAAAINTSGGPDRSPGFAVSSYFNLGFYYQQLGMLSRALAYFDTAVIYAQRTGKDPDRLLKARLNKVLLFVLNGDYQKAIDESTIGLARAAELQNASLTQSFLNQRALSFLHQSQYRQAMSDADSALRFDQKVHDTFQLANAFKTKALIYGYQQQPALANQLFTQAIQLRIRTANNEQIANDYIDLGNYYQNTLQDYGRAAAAYNNTLSYAGKAGNSAIVSKVYTNLGAIRFRQGKYSEALQLYARALAVLTGRADLPVLINPNFASLTTINNRDLLLMIFVNKVDAAIHLYRQNNTPAWLDLSLRTALLTDSLITMLRHQQIGEQSKLYWRNKTREIFANALDACYFSGNTTLAFFFMEKSRAVILNDKLNELGAQTRLPVKEALLQRQLEVDLTVQQQRLAAIPADSPAYGPQQQLLLRDREQLEHYILSLEHRYPVYYQYKYADSVPALSALQQYLAANKAVFLHFFTTDSVLYILRIGAEAPRLFRVANNKTVVDFLRACEDETGQNAHYKDFSRLSHQLYELLFKPLSVPGGRVIVCSDDFLLPFEALYEDVGGRRPLLYDYAFSYVYSARTLLNSSAGRGAPSDQSLRVAKGNFIGFAPVSFEPGMHLPDLLNSADSLRTAAAAYQQSDLYTNKIATRSNFLEKMPDYAVVNIFSHARADSSGSEPVLYLQDSLIHLSELQLLSYPATQLVVLSACQTGAGHNASGEGIYSLARGFASAGIPAVAATLWEADESAIYALSGRFHFYLSQGLSKDLALQKAKLDYIRHSGKQASLPWYWAGLIITGDTAPVRLSSPASLSWWWVGLATLIAIILFYPLLYKPMDKLIFG